MPDLIKLLPDSVANQIAAGEVIQRPASAAKELLENAIDSGASDIKLVIRDSGRVLIQVIDDGCGMSVTDARMCFERHATSKIKEANDLFAIRTLGFRGEALASIAAIAQVQMKTRRFEDELGTLIEIDGATLKNQAPCSCPAGTSIMVKNLFFNVPARRNFLKSNNAELRHIIDEFQRVALVHPNIAFSLINNDKPMFVLQKSGIKQRIISLMGNHFNNRLLPVEQETQEVAIKGYIGKPEFARKTRGEQFYFVNGRFIRNPYLHHAVETAYQELIPEGSYPVYFIYLKVDPSTIDINIHPTKTEVNFQHNQLIYTTLRAAVKQSLGKFSLAPEIDFEAETSINITSVPPDYVPRQPGISINPGYNPFNQQSDVTFKPSSKSVDPQWRLLLDYKTERGQEDLHTALLPDRTTEGEKERETDLFQINGSYIVTKVKSSLMVIDQFNAHLRIIYDRLMEKLAGNQPGSQQSLFPQNISLAPADAEIIRELSAHLNILGFCIEPLGINTFVVSGIPADIPESDPGELLEKIIDNYKKNLADLKIDKRINLALSMARQLAVKPGRLLQKQEMTNIVNELFACPTPEVAPDGNPTLKIISREEIYHKFHS
ncbi:MAG: DNA mismatch repair endonuclease MutL [Bacteroidales bacterium]|nr:DNA mismatch repair endonuclease MutL [Bacteroidales bacterium]MDZ4203663.1 DNA mismatch repair endonuclease MutL [Bacteroidales bacterium]